MSENTENTINNDPVAEVVWSHIKYTPCEVEGNSVTIMEIINVWEMIDSINRLQHSQ